MQHIQRFRSDVVSNRRLRFNAQIGHGTRSDVTILPTLIINNRQYRGKLDKGAVLKAICAGFQEATEPAVCLSEGMETNECLKSNGGCWEDKKSNVTACKDTFRGRICECPLVGGEQFKGDGYNHCEGMMMVDVTIGWATLMMILLGLVVAGAVGYVVYKYRIRSYMDSEMRAIMAQYMPLDNQSDIHQHLHDEEES